jgi:predicted secreted protein
MAEYYFPNTVDQNIKNSIEELIRICCYTIQNNIEPESRIMWSLNDKQSSNVVEILEGKPPRSWTVGKSTISGWIIIAFNDDDGMIHTTAWHDEKPFIVGDNNNPIPRYLI